MRGEIKRLAPFFVILLVFLIVFRLTGPDRISEVRILKETQSGLTAITPAQYLLTQFRVIVTYLRLLFFPVNQNLDYDYPIAQTLGQAPVLTSFIFMMLILAAAVMLFRKYRLLSFSIFWFFLALVPESSVLPIRDVIFEHRLYLPMVGFCLFLPVVLYYLSGDKRWKPAVILMLVIIAGYSIMTYNRNRVWKDEITLWTDVVKKSPNKARPYSNRGMAYSLQGEYEKAIADCGRAVQLSPNYAAAYCNRASAYYFSGNYNLAIVDYTRAIELQPTLSDAYFNRGFAYQKKKEYDRAIFDWSRVVELKPRDQDAYFNRAWMYVEKGEYDRAIADCSQVIRETPRFAGAYFMRANAYRHKGLYADALVDYTQALKINPAYGEAYNNRALLFVSLGEYQSARGDIRKMEELGFPFNPALRKLLPEPDK